MADISVTAGSVATSTAAVVHRDNNAGATITAGKSVYLDTAGLWQLCICNSTAVLAGSGLTFGVALHASLSGQPLAVQTGGSITIGATVVAGGVYCISSTSGGIAPLADLLAVTGGTIRVTYLGFASTTGVIDMSIRKYTGTVVA